MLAHPMTTEAVFAMTSPLDGAALGDVTATLTDQIPEIVAKAREAQRAWADTSVDLRVKALLAVNPLPEILDPSSHHSLRNEINHGEHWISGERKC